MNTTEAVLDQTVEQLARMNTALIGVPELRSTALPLLNAK